MKMHPRHYAVLLILVASLQHALPFSVSTHRIAHDSRLSSMKNSEVPRFRESLSTKVASTSVAAMEASIRSENQKDLGKIQSALVKFGMFAYIASMCVALPVTLFPIQMLHKIKLLTRIQRERCSLRMGQACARWLLRLIPFYKLTVTPASPNLPPSVWVCNHQSMLDVFIMLAADKKMRGKSKRPIKIVYWKGLEDNPITKLLFTRSGFISVDMAPNKPGEENQYDRASFKALLKSTKKAFEEGFDIGILPEGQLNPEPEKGLLPAFSGAFTLAKMSRRPIQLMALWGTHRLWHPLDELNEGKPKGRHVKLRVYPHYTGRTYESSEEFVETFSNVVGHFGKTGTDLPPEQLLKWLNGNEWKERKLAHEKLEEEEKLVLEQAVTK